MCPESVLCRLQDLQGVGARLRAVLVRVPRIVGNEDVIDEVITAYHRGKVRDRDC
jgi:hypothetical protein